MVGHGNSRGVWFDRARRLCDGNEVSIIRPESVRGRSRLTFPRWHPSPDFPPRGHNAALISYGRVGSACDTDASRLRDLENARSVERAARK